MILDFKDIIQFPAPHTKPILFMNTEGEIYAGCICEEGCAHYLNEQGYAILHNYGIGSNWPQITHWAAFR